jgi:hypothetical protein
MARGWESKDVERQIEASARTRHPHTDKQPGPEQAEQRRRREGLLLSRSRVLHDLEEARNPRYRTMLSAALTHLDHELAGLTA